MAEPAPEGGGGGGPSISCSTRRSNNYDANYLVTFLYFRIKTLVTADPSALDGWIGCCLDDNYIHADDDIKVVVGLDLKLASGNADPSPLGDNDTRNPASIHLCYDDKCIMFQFRPSPDGAHNLQSTSRLGNFLTQPRVHFVGIGMRNKINAIKRFQPHLQIDNAHDVRDWAVNQREELNPEDVEHLDLSGLVKSVFDLDYFEGCGGELPAEGTTDWATENITEEKIMYAALDCFMVSMLGEALRPPELI